MSKIELKSKSKEPTGNGVTAWSISRLNTYTQCPFKFKLTAIDKIREPSSPAMERGAAIHKEAEVYLKGADLVVPTSLSLMTTEFLELKEHRAEAELEVTFNKDWGITGWFDKDAWCRIKIDAMVLLGDTIKIIDFKGLALDTLLPTPLGWTTMGAVAVGDELLSSSGAPCTVTNKSTVHHNPCYKLSFDDTTSITCDHEHRWVTTEGTKTTVELQVKDQIKLVEPLKLVDQDLELSPYVLGAWLGDGRKRDGSIGKGDAELFKHIEDCGYIIGKNISGKRTADCPLHTIKGLRKQLRLLGLLNNKHIPSKYLRGSYWQRVELLQGLLDTDGTVNVQRKEVSFSTVAHKLADRVFELLVTLGQRPCLHTINNATNFAPQGLTHYRVTFRPQHGLVPFKLSRKLQKVGTWGAGNSAVRRLVSIELVDTVPTQCLTVDAPDHTYLCTKAMMPTHNTGKYKKDDNDAYEQQLELYALAALILYPDVKYVDASLWFVDSGDHVGTKQDSYTHAMVPDLKKKWELKVTPMFVDTLFAERPNKFCNWCFFRKANNGPCSY